METTRLTTAQALVRWMINQYIELDDGEREPVFAGVFGIFGHGNVTCLAEALEPVQNRLPTWRGHNEQGMALSAVAYAKAMRRRRIMVATSSIGPGCTNMVTAAAVAHANRLPLLLLSGDTFQHRLVDPVLQQVENFDDPTVTVADTFKPVVRYWDRITRPQQVLRSLPQALETMLDPADCGPAFIALPQDVQAEAYDYPAAFFEPRTHIIRRPGPDRRDVARAARILAGAEKPLIIAGGGVHYAGAVDAVTDFVERRGIPVVETVAGKSAFVHHHPNFVGAVGVTGVTSANAVAEEADVVVAIGSRLQDFTTGSWALFKNPDVEFVAINTARWDAVKQMAAPVIGDALLTVRALDEELGDYRAPGSWLEFGSEAKSEWDAHLDRLAEAHETPEGTPSYAQVIQMINRLCDDGDYCLSAAGGLPGELVAGWRSKAVDTFDAEYGFSTMGYEISGALGARMARADGDVIAFVGDGSYLMMNSDIYSTIMTGHKVIFIVCDNGGFAVINRLQVNQGGAEFNNLLRTTRHDEYLQVDFAKHAESMGAATEHIESLEELPAAFARAKDSDRSYVIVVDVAQYEWVGGGTWWEVGVPEVSERPEVLVARAEWEAESKHQRPGV